MVLKGVFYRIGEQLYDTEQALREETLKTDYYSRKSYDFRIGHAILLFPRWIKHRFDRKKNGVLSHE